MRILIKSVEVWDKKTKSNADILLSNGFIERIERGINKKADIVIDGSGCVALPLFIDLHAHLRYPGEEHKETLETGLKGALKGGFYSVVSMPNTNPPIDSPELVKLVKQKSSEVGASHVLVAAAITKKLEGKKKNSLEELYLAGASAFSDDGKSVTDGRILYEAALEAKSLNVPLLLHEEDYGLSNLSGINDGWASYKTGLKGNSYLSETVLAVRDMIIATEVGAKIHIQHVSSKETVKALKHYKTELITAEVTPHHLIFDETYTVNLNTLYKVNPPLRKKEDREALLEALNEGFIDCIATDHAPHTYEDKMLPYALAPSGISWFELFFPAVYSMLIEKGFLTSETFIRASVENPAKVIGIKPPRIAEGEKASFAIFDVSKKSKIEKEYPALLSKNNPLYDKELYGFTKGVFFEGAIRFMDGRFIDEKGGLNE